MKLLSMRILSHRGFWRSPSEKNTTEAFQRSFQSGFGTETDLRDLDGALVIAHDPARKGALSVEAFLAQHRAADPGLPLALNIKADGLQTMVVDLLERLEVPEAFVFDMSVPDMLGWLRSGVPTFTRLSDIEPEPLLADRAAGIWLDAFHSDWWEAATVLRLLDQGLGVCVVSPELHRRDHRAAWEVLATAAQTAGSDRLMLCTDFPQEAREFF
jgi:glycerophosphoryl diester phosphodiesterase